MYQQKSLLRRHTAIAAFVCALFMADPVSAATKCQRIAIKQIAKFDKQLAKVQARFEERRNRLVDGYLQHIDDTDRRDALAADLEAVVDGFELDDVLSRSREKKSVLTEFIAADEPEACKAGDGSAYIFDRTIEVLGVNHETALEALQDRIDIETVGPNEGLVVLAMYIDGRVMRLTLDKRGSMTGARAFKNVKVGQFFRIIKLPAGEYQWTTVRTSEELTRSYFADRTLYYYDFRDRDLSFKVEPGKLNFTGVLMYSGSGYADIKDRTSIVMRLVENRYPEFLERYPAVNGLVPGDKYLDFFLSEKRSWQEVQQ
ncbi:MAG: hypothetical protein AAGH76_08175 [Pseudomonadota bacterium]